MADIFDLILPISNIYAIVYILALSQALRFCQINFNKSV